jgi:hypothetical protein
MRSYRDQLIDLLARENQIARPDEPEKGVKSTTKVLTQSAVLGTLLALFSVQSPGNFFTRSRRRGSSGAGQHPMARGIAEQPDVEPFIGTMRPGARSTCANAGLGSTPPTPQPRSYVALMPWMTGQ